MILGAWYVIAPHLEQEPSRAVMLYSGSPCRSLVGLVDQAGDGYEGGGQHSGALAGM